PCPGNCDRRRSPGRRRRSSGRPGRREAHYTIRPPTRYRLPAILASACSSLMLPLGVRSDGKSADLAAQPLEGLFGVAVGGVVEDTGSRVPGQVATLSDEADASTLAAPDGPVNFHRTVCRQLFGVEKKDAVCRVERSDAGSPVLRHGDVDVLAHDPDAV